MKGIEVNFMIPGEKLMINYGDTAGTLTKYGLARVAGVV